MDRVRGKAPDDSRLPLSSCSPNHSSVSSSSDRLCVPTLSAPRVCLGEVITRPVVTEGAEGGELIILPLVSSTSFSRTFASFSGSTDCFRDLTDLTDFIDLVDCAFCAACAKIDCTVPISSPSCWPDNISWTERPAVCWFPEDVIGELGGLPTPISPLSPRSLWLNE